MWVGDQTLFWMSHIFRNPLNLAITLFILWESPDPP
jgi:hypothetical protein